MRWIVNVAETTKQMENEALSALDLTEDQSLDAVKREGFAEALEGDTFYVYLVEKLMTSNPSEIPWTVYI